MFYWTAHCDAAEGFKTSDLRHAGDMHLRVGMEASGTVSMTVLSGHGDTNDGGATSAHYSMSRALRNCARV